MRLDDLLISEPNDLSLVTPERINDFIQTKNELEESISHNDCHTLKGLYHYNLAKLFHHCPLTYHACYPKQDKQEYLKAIMLHCNNAYWEYHAKVEELKNEKTGNRFEKRICEIQMQYITELLRLQLCAWDLRDPFLVTTENVLDKKAMQSLLAQKYQIIDIFKNKPAMPKPKRNLCLETTNAFFNVMRMAYKTTQYMAERCCKPRRIGFFSQEKAPEIKQQSDAASVYVMQLDS